MNNYYTHFVRLTVLIRPRCFNTFIKRRYIKTVWRFFLHFLRGLIRCPAFSRPFCVYFARMVYNLVLLTVAIYPVAPCQIITSFSVRVILRDGVFNFFLVSLYRCLAWRIHSRTLTNPVSDDCIFFIIVLSTSLWRTLPTE